MPPRGRSQRADRPETVLRVAAHRVSPAGEEALRRQQLGAERVRQSDPCGRGEDHGSDPAVDEMLAQVLEEPRRPADVGAVLEVGGMVDAPCGVEDVVPRLGHRAAGEPRDLQTDVEREVRVGHLVARPVQIQVAAVGESQSVVMEPDPLLGGEGGDIGDEAPAARPGDVAPARGEQVRLDALAGQRGNGQECAHRLAIAVDS